MSEMSFISLHDILSKPELDLGFILQIISIISSGVVRVKLKSTSHGLPIYDSYDILYGSFRVRSTNFLLNLRDPPSDFDET